MRETLEIYSERRRLRQKSCGTFLPCIGRDVGAGPRVVARGAAQRGRTAWTTSGEGAASNMDDWTIFFSGLTIGAAAALALAAGYRRLREARQDRDDEWDPY